jgi:hypothetical protein
LVASRYTGTEPRGSITANKKRMVVINSFIALKVYWSKDLFLITVLLYAEI